MQVSGVPRPTRDLKQVQQTHGLVTGNFRKLTLFKLLLLIITINF